VARLSQVIQLDEGKIQAHQGEVVRATVVETLNTLLNAETCYSGLRLSGVPHLAGILRYW